MEWRIQSWCGERDFTSFEKKIGLTLIGGAGVVYAFKWIKSWRQNKHYERRSREHRELVKRDIEQLEERLRLGKLSQARRDEICNLSLHQLSQQLNSGQVKPTEALEAYQSKALEAHKKTNCLCGVFTNAEEVAKSLEQSTEKQGVLYGVPVSLKDNLRVKGFPSTYGLAKNIDTNITEDCVVAAVLKKQGVVPFVQTNMPQCGMSIETGNPVFGTTVNPIDPSRTPGGSSGGEGALIGFGASVLGIGTDIGGSVRVPAANCGICALRPTDGRVSKKGLPSLPGQNVIRAVFGPMARDVDSLAVAMRALCIPYMHELDPTISPLPFNNDEYESSRTLRIGYYTYDGYVKATPACERAVMVAKEALERRGHTLVPWQPETQQEVMYMAFRVYNGDGARILGRNLKDETIDPSVEAFKRYASYSSVWRAVITGFYRLLGNRRLARYIDSYQGTKSVADWWKLASTIYTYRERLLENWREQGLDGIICPATPYPATKVGNAGHIFRSGSYIIHYNVANCPAGVLPVTKVTQQDIQQLMTEGPTDDDLYNFARQDAEGSEGLPVGVQCVAKTFEEEKCLRIMREVERGVQLG